MAYKGIKPCRKLNFRHLFATFNIQEVTTSYNNGVLQSYSQTLFIYTPSSCGLSRTGPDLNPAVPIPDFISAQRASSSTPHFNDFDNNTFSTLWYTHKYPRLCLGSYYVWTSLNKFEYSNLQHSAKHVGYFTEYKNETGCCAKAALWPTVGTVVLEAKC